MRVQHKNNSVCECVCIESKAVAKLMNNRVVVHTHQRSLNIYLYAKRPEGE